MGGMAVTMQLRLDESSDLLPYVPVLMLLDRRADVHLAKRSAADGWVIKPLDPLMLQRAVDRILTTERDTATTVPTQPGLPDGAEDAPGLDGGSGSGEEQPVEVG